MTFLFFVFLLFQITRITEAYYFCDVDMLPKTGNSMIFKLDSKSINELPVLLGGQVSAMYGRRLQPGDQIHLSADTYTFDDTIFVDVRGTETNPVVIRSAPGELAFVKFTNPLRNGFELAGDLNFTFWFVRLFVFYLMDCLSSQ